MSNSTNMKHTASQPKTAREACATYTPTRRSRAKPATAIGCTVPDSDMPDLAKRVFAGAAPYDALQSLHPDWSHLRIVRQVPLFQVQPGYRSELERLQNQSVDERLLESAMSAVDAPETGMSARFKAMEIADRVRARIEAKQSSVKSVASDELRAFVSTVIEKDPDVQPYRPPSHNLSDSGSTTHK